jgi:hypothetical protein
MICFGWTTAAPKLNELAPVDPLQKLLVSQRMTSAAFPQKLKQIPINSQNSPRGNTRTTMIH